MKRKIEFNEKIINKKQKFETEEGTNEISILFFDSYIIQRIFIQLHNICSFCSDARTGFVNCYFFALTSKVFHSVSKQTYFDLNILNNEKIKKLNYNSFFKLSGIKNFLNNSEDIVNNNELLNQMLIYSSKHGFHDLLKELVDNGADVNCTDGKYERSPLFHSCRSSFFKTSKKLISLGSNVNQQDRFKLTPLIEACSSTRNLKLIQHLVNRGADITLTDSGNKTPLFSACSHSDANLIKYLVSIGSNVNHRNDLGNAPLHYLCRAFEIPSIPKILPLAQYFISKGANIHCTNNLGESPLATAVSSGHLPLVHYLISLGCDLHQKNILQESLLFHACCSKNLELLKYLVSLGLDINAYNRNGESLLLKASRPGSIDILKYLLSFGFDINQKNNRGQTVLYRICCIYGDLPTAKFLIGKGADLSLTYEAQQKTILQILTEKQNQNSYKEITLFLQCLNDVLEEIDVK